MLNIYINKCNGLSYTHTYTHTPIPCYTMHTFIIFIYVLLGQPACGEDLSKEDEFQIWPNFVFFCWRATVKEKSTVGPN